MAIESPMIRHSRYRPGDTQGAQQGEYNRTESLPVVRREYFVPESARTRRSRLRSCFGYKHAAVFMLLLIVALPVLVNYYEENKLEEERQTTPRRKIKGKDDLEGPYAEVRMLRLLMKNSKEAIDDKMVAESKNRVASFAVTDSDSGRI